MILVSPEIGSAELHPIISKLGVSCEKSKLTYGDVAFEGYGPYGFVGVGLERKKLRDMLQCIDDGRFSGHQAVGMRGAYKFCFLVIEGEWKPHDLSGAIHITDDSGRWYEMRPRTAYSKLRRFLFTVELAGWHVLFTRNISQTAYDVVELYQWFQKPWHKHTGMQGLHHPGIVSTADISLTALKRKPSLVRRWARDLDGIDVVISEAADQVFKSGRDLANADEVDWLKVPGIGVGTAQRLVKEIGARRR